MPDCPNREAHTPLPYMYDELWLDQMTSTHRQVKCPGCHRWCIWVPKGAPVPSDETTEGGT